MRPDPGEGFPKQLRLRQRREFLVVQRSRHRVVTEHFIFYARHNGNRPTRLGITASRKVGKAHVRNRAKRLVREAYRRNRQHLPEGLDLVAVIRAGRAPDVYRTVEAELIDAAGRVMSSAGRRRRKRR